jgi:hypothetical protein
VRRDLAARLEITRYSYSLLSSAAIRATVSKIWAGGDFSAVDVNSR